MDPSGHGALLLSEPRRRGSAGTRTRTVLEARWMGSSMGSQDSLSGPLVHSAPLHQQLPRTHRSSSSLLLAVFSQIQHCAAGGHGVGARICASSHSQTQEGVKVNVTASGV